MGCLLLKCITRLCRHAVIRNFVSLKTHKGARTFWQAALVIALFSGDVESWCTRQESNL